MALKAQWTVRAGVIPGEAIKTFCGEWQYTSLAAEADRLNAGDPGYHSEFSKLRAEAMDYYLQVSMPQLNNWATIEFLWL